MAVPSLIAYWCNVIKTYDDSGVANEKKYTAADSEQTKMDRNSNENKSFLSNYRYQML